MFKNMKIGGRLAIGFAVVLALMAGMVLYSVSQVSTISDSITKVVSDRNVKVRQCNQVIKTVDESLIAVRDMLMTLDIKEVNKDNDLLVENSANITKVLDSLETSIKSDEGKALLKRMVDARVSYREAQKKAMDYGMKNTEADNVLGVKVLFDELRPAQEKYIQAINDLIDFQTTLANSDGKAASTSASSLTSLLIIVGLISILLAVVLGVFITKSITTRFAAT